MIYLIDPNLINRGCPTKGCPAYCAILCQCKPVAQPLYGIPGDEI